MGDFGLTEETATKARRHRTYTESAIVYGDILKEATIYDIGTPNLCACPGSSCKSGGDIRLGLQVVVNDVSRRDLRN